MSSIVRDFSGKLNLDVHPSRVPPGDYVDAMGITRDAQNAGNDLVVSNIVGNRLVSYSFKEGTINKCIKGFEDPLKNRVIEFIWNDQGYHSILIFDKEARTRTKVLESRTDSGDVDILKFQLLYKVNSVNIIHRDEGDLLFFSDAYNRPAGFNITSIQSGIYGALTEDLIRVAKMPPLNSLLPVFGDQLPVSNVNNFKKKLLRYRYRWVYESGYKSTWSPISKAVLPDNAYDNNVESDPSKNNQVTLTVVGGGADYKSIEIAGQQSLGNLWSEWFLIDSLDKDDYGIASGNTYNYVFLNDGEYTFLDPLETDLLYDYVPDIAGNQELLNGNVLGYGDITEGYPAIKRSDVSVNISSSLVDTDSSGVISDNPSISYIVGRTQFGTTCPPFAGSPQSKAYLEITIGDIVGVADMYNVKFKIFGGLYVNESYSALVGNTKSDVAQALRTQIDAALGASYNVTYIAPDKIRILNNVCSLFGSTIFSEITITAIPANPIVSAGGQATWKWNAKYRLGIVYYDIYGKTNGVISFISNTDDPTDFSVTTPDFIVDPTTRNPRLPVINASINSLPPSWAVRYQWVRTLNHSVSSFVQIATMDVQSDAGFYYFCIQGLKKFKEENTGFVPTYSFQEGDRLRVLSDIDIPGERYGTTTYKDDFEILGTAEREIVASPATNGTFLKVKKNATVFSGDNYLIEVYRTATRTSDGESVFYEFGESYPIYTDTDNIRYHVGSIQNQTALQPATFTFSDGDVYYKFRAEYENVSLNTFVILGLMDPNYSDYWASEVNSNGRPLVIDVNAQRVHNPVLIRFGQAYQSGTNINGLNRFYPNDYDEYFRDYGAIMRLSIRDKMLHVYQKLRIGRVPIYGQIVKDQAGTEQVLISDKLLNPIQYYAGQFGIGDHPEILASNNYTDYFGSNIRTTINKLGQGGLEPISITHEINNFCVTQLGARGFNSKCYGVFDSYNNLYIIALEAAGDLPAITLVWNEQRNGFESFLPYHPEMLCCLNQLLITWKDGQLYTHDSDTYNNFYGVQYDSYITPVFNDNRLEKKTWQNVTELASDIWECPVITTQLNSYVIPVPTKQLSLLKEVEFADLEGEFHAVLRGDSNIDINNGTVLKGTYMIARFQSTQSDRLTYLDTVVVEFVESNKNVKK